MKNIKKSALSIAIVACMAGAFSALPAAATTITITGFSQPNPTTVNVATVTPTLTQQVRAGGFNAQSGSSNFIAWCADLLQTINFGEAVTDYMLVDGVTAIGAARADALGRLATQFLGAVNSGPTAGAFQLATWEILFENVGTGFNLNSGNFSASGASDASISIAQNWLNNLSSANAFSVSIFQSKSRQDIAVFTPVPEPATLGLLAIGLIGIGAIKRKGDRFNGKRA